MQRAQKISADYNAMLALLREVVQDASLPALAEAIREEERACVPAPYVPAATPELPLQLIGLGFQLLNLVEENAAVQLRRWQEKEGTQPLRATFDGLMCRVKELDASAAELRALADATRVELVLTAHPTEARRRSVITHYRELYVLVASLENPVYTPRERERLRGEMSSCLERLWRTGEVHIEKPTVAAERAYVLHYALNLFPEALQRVADRFQRAVVGPLGEALPLPRLRFGSWVGGDRDGHPFVTPEVTQQTLQEMRLSAVVLARRQLSPLGEKLSISEPFAHTPQVLRDAIDRGATALGERAAAVLRRNRAEPFRQLVGLMMARLPVEVERDHITRLVELPGSYPSAQELCEDLRALQAGLREVGATHLADEEVRRALRVVEAFGFHLATLDLRQNSQVHEAAIDELIAWAGLPMPPYSSLDEPERCAFLREELLHRRPLGLPDASCGANADAVRGAYQVFASHLRRYGRCGLGPTIVSMTRQVSDLLAVYLLQREAGLLHVEGDRAWADLPVVPLFETIEDLQRAPAVMDAYLGLPLVQATLAACREGDRPVQQVMVGYSDSNKDGGLVAAQVAVERAERSLARVADAHGICLEVFHGRGGSTARGGGPNGPFLAARPRDAFSGRVRVTVQGETVARELANLMTATNTLETWLAGAMQASLERKSSTPRDPALDAVLMRFASYAQEAYQEWLTAPGLLAYFRQATPIDVLEQSGIGSRPTRRRGAHTLADLRAIPWVFSWNQCRHCIPSWYGVGSALERIARETPEDLRLLAQGARHDAFLSNLLHNIEMGLAAAHVPWARRYAALVAEAEQGDAMLARFEEERSRTLEGLHQVLGQPVERRRPALVASIDARAAALDQVHAAQIDLLVSWRDRVRSAGPDDDQAQHLRRRLLMTVNAIAAGLRSTG